MKENEIEIRKLIEQDIDLKKAFGEVQMARTPFVLKHFVIGQHETDQQQYAQCVLELQIKYDAIRRSLLSKEKLIIERDELLAESQKCSSENESRKKEIDALIKEIDIEEQDRAMLGAVREFYVLYDMFKSFKKKYTRDDLNDNQKDYWEKRITRQANQDVLATGRVSTGNADALRMVGLSPVPELDHVRQVEQRYLEVCDLKILVVVPTEEQAINGLPCVNGIITPSGAQIRYLNVFGRKVDEAYDYGVREAIRDEADFVFTVEDDTFPPADALVRLFRYCKENPRTIWGGWYPKRQDVREGTPIVIKDGHREPLDCDEKIHECYTLPMGCTLFPIEVFLQTEQPWFKTTEHLTQDSFFSQLARDASWKLMCDTSIKCRHIDRVTKKVYS